MEARAGIRRVTSMTRAELREATDMLAQTFHDHPYAVSLFPRVLRRLQALRALFVSGLKDALRFGHVDMARDGKIVGVLISYPPGAYPMTPLRMLRLLPDFIRLAAVSPMGAVRLLLTKRRLDPLHPKEPHLYCLCIGVEVGGAGNTLVKYYLDKADAAELPIYAETQKQSAVRWLRAVGFQVLREGVEMFPAGPPTWTIWREPRRKNDRTGASA